jgi:hypothetical protein
MMKALGLGGLPFFVAAAAGGCWWGLFGPHQEVSIRGYWINAEDPPSPREGCVLHFTTSQRGEASHFGAFTGTGATCIASPPGETDEPPHFFYDDAPPYFVAAFTNEMVWTNEQGHALRLEPNEGVFVQSLSTQQVSVLGTLRVAGGTGRWRGASGELTVRSATEDGLRLEIEGRIRLDH